MEPDHVKAYEYAQPGITMHRPNSLSSVEAGGTEPPHGDVFGEIALPGRG
jgi:hypothetical protein